MQSPKANVLVTGGAGFIGSHLVDGLLADGHRVRVYDDLDPQVHGDGPPSYLSRDAQFVRGDVCDAEALDAALDGIDVVFHFAAAVGVGQSMYQPLRYTRVNTLGSATLLDLLVNSHRSHVRKVIVAASMSEYGEGLYRCSEHGEVKPSLRSDEQLAQRRWEVSCPACGRTLVPIATPERTPLGCNSVYALNKRDQEDYLLLIGATFGIPTVALRFFNVYGPRQSLSNPYTGVAAIFISRLKAERNPTIFEDGHQSRDFVSVHDIVSACLAVMNDARADGEVFNVGSGQQISILELAELIIAEYRSTAQPEVVQQFRKGDIRHCFADVSKIEERLGWKPTADRRAALRELMAWSESAPSQDTFDEAAAILKRKGII
ncbi:MAG: NAD-dependent epimerase/dehydratase family protein [Candidatus Eremiobacteraeota bacterium]|nr:NAD-dependent epimerase/dehydratase family protein [Candidatus Eremiobacteraeota bacterium]